MREHVRAMELYQVMRTSAAVRSFTDQPVNACALHRILDHARFAPSGGNRQGWHVIVLRDPALRAAVRDGYLLGWREYMAHVRAGLVPFAPDADGCWTGPAVDLAQAREQDAPDAFGDNLDRVPVLLLITVSLPALAVVDNGLDRQSIVGGGSVYPFCQNLLLAARNEGLAGVMTTVICRAERSLAKQLHLPRGHAIAALIALGHPLRQPQRLRRRMVEEFTTIDRFDGPSFPSEEATP